MRSARHPVIALLTIVAVLMAAAACSSTAETTTGADGTAGSGAAGEPALQVVATTSILADFASEVGGDRVEVYTVIKANVDAHDFEPAPADIEAIADADVIVTNGVGLEEWLDPTIESAQPEGVIVDTSTGVELREGAAHSDEEAHADEEEGHSEGEEGHSEGGYDPHIWHSPLNAKIMVDNIEQAFVTADPDGASTYEANAAAYERELDELDQAVEADLATLSNRKIVTNHDALGYYIDRYELEFVGSIIPSFDSSAELSAADIDAIVALIRENGVKAVFSESSIPPRTAEAIGQEAGVTVVAGEDALYGDSLGPDGSSGSSYIGMIQHNTDTIVANLT